MDIDLTIEGRVTRVARIALNRPEKRNALALAMWRSIPDLMAQALAVPGLRLLIVEGKGGHFSGGADIDEFSTLYATPQAALAAQIVIQAAMRAIEDFPLPTLAVIEGVCYGGGCGLALACDLRYAAATARFAITPAKLGLVYGVDDTRRLVAAVGFARAKDMLFTGRTLTAEDALHAHLVDALYPLGEIQAAVSGFADSIMSTAATSASATKRILRKLSSGTLHDDAESQAMFADAFSSLDFSEGFAAFQEKRPPRFP